MEPEVDQEVQTPPGDPKYKLWQSLNASKFYTKSYDDFNTQFSNPESISKLYGALSQNKYYTKPLTDFQNQFFTAQKKSPDETGLPEYITPHPSSGSDATTSILAHDAASLNAIAKGDTPIDYHPGATPKTDAYSDKPRTDREILLAESKRENDQDEADATANGGKINAYSIVGSMNQALAKGTDALATWFHAAGASDAFGGMSNTGKVLDWATDYLNNSADANPLPNTIAGQITGGVAKTVPTILGAVATGGSTTEAQIGGYLTKSEILQQALTKAASPLTKWLAGSGGFEQGSEAYKATGGKILPTILGAAAGTQEGLESGIGLEGQMAAADKLGGSLFNLALKTGVVNEDGLITQQALKSIVAAPVVFGTASVAEDVANGRPIDWKNAGVSAATALPFEAQHIVGSVGEQGELNDKKAQLDNHINDVLQAADANSIINFSTARPDDLVEAMQRQESPQELQVLALAKGVEAQKAETYQEKNTLHLEQLQLQQHADIKGIGDAIVQHGIEPFANAVNQTDLPDEIKSTLINKAHGINQEFNPVIKEQAATQETVADLTGKIDHLQSIPGATDPVNNPAGVTDLIDMVEQRTDAQVKLLDDLTNNPLQVPDDIDKAIIPKSDINTERMQRSSSDRAKYGGSDTEFYIPKELASEAYSKYAEQEGKRVQSYDEIIRRGGFSAGELDSLTPDWRNEIRKPNEQEKETQAPAEAPNLEGGFQLKSKDFGQITIVPRTDGEFDIHDGEGGVTQATKEDLANTFNFDTDKIGAPEHVQTLNGTENPNEIARLYDEKMRELKEPSNSIEHAIANYGPTTTREQFGNQDDLNNLKGSPTIALNYFRKEGVNNLDTQADEINHLYFNGEPKVSEQDITDFMKKYPNGARSFFSPKGNAELAEMAQRYRDLTGKDIDSKKARILAAQYDNVTPNEIREIERQNDSKEVTDKIKSFIKDQLDKPGLQERDEVVDRLEKEFERYLQDPNNQFNLFYDEFKGDLLDENEQQQFRDAIAEEKNEQLRNGADDTGLENENGSDAPGQETEEPAGEPVTEDDLPFQRGEGTSIPPERAEVVQGLMKKVFPNVESIFHPTIDSFAEAARANHIDATDLPNAFVDGKGTIHFNPEALHADTQIHEYGHILTQWAKANAPTLYKRMVAFGRDAADIKAELKGRGYKIRDSQLNEEAFVTMLGRHGEGKLDEVIKNSGTRGTVAKFINDIWTKFQRYLIDKTGFDISKFRNIKDMPINEFLDTVNSKYLLSDTKVSDIGTKEYSQIDQQRPERPMREDGESMADWMRRVIDWTRQQTTGQKTADFTEDVNKKEEKPGYNFEETSIKNKVTREERRQRDMQEIEYQGKRDFDTVWDKAKQMVDSNEIDPRQLAQNIIDRPRPLPAEQSAALAYDRMKLYNEHKQTMDVINDAKDNNDKDAEQNGRLRLATVEANIERNDQAAKVAGYEQGLGLAIRKLIASKDYSLVHQLELAKIANGNKELSPEWRAKFEALSQKLQEAEKKLSDYETNAKSKAQATSLARLKKEIEIEQRSDKKNKRVQTADQIDKSIAARKAAIYDKLFKNKSATVIPIPYADRLIEIAPDITLLAKDYIKKGINSFEGLVDQLHDDLKDHIDGLTKRDLADTLSGYGKAKKPNKDEIDAQLRELKSQGRLLSALEDARNGERPLKSGFTPDKPSERVRELQKQVHDAMRENGIEVEKSPISEEDAWKTALESVKTRLKNEINDLNKQLETGIKPGKKSSVILDQEATDLKAERDRLKAVIAETEGNKELTDQQRVEMLTKATEKSIEEYKQRIADLKTTGKDKIGDERAAKRNALKDLINTTPELKALRDRLETLQETHAKIIDDSKPKVSGEQRALDAFKKRMIAKIAELQDRIDKGDYSDIPKKQKQTYQLDDRAKALQSEVNRLQRNFDETRAIIKEKAKPGIVKAFDWFAKWRRLGFLLNPLTAIKITAGAIERVAISPLEEAIGSGLSLIPGIDRVSAKAPREGASLSIQDLAAAEARVLVNTFSKKTVQEAYRTFKTGKSELEELYDSDKEKFIHPEDGLFSLPGRAHGGLQAIAKQNEYYRSMEKRLAHAMKNGYDVTDPDIQHAALIEAFKDGNPSLFNDGKTISYNEIRQAAIKDSKRAAYQQGDNPISKLFSVSNLEKGNDGEQILAAIFKATFPFTKQPVNYAFEAGSYTLGAVKSLFILRNGIEKLTPEQADTVMRNFKKNGAGAAFMALGWFLHGAIAGFWNKDEKWTDKGMQPNDVEIVGVKVPHLLIDHPLFLAMEAGATAKNVNDAIDKKNGAAPMANGLLDAVGGIVEHIPYADNPITDALSNQNSGKANRIAGAAGNLTRQIILTPMIEQVAKWMDENDYGNTNKRKTSGKSAGESFINSFESGIPGLRTHLKKK